jgi:hypothetical protein
MTDWNFIGVGGSQRTGLTAGVVAENNVNTCQRFAVKLVVSVRIDFRITDGLAFGIFGSYAHAC